MIRIVEDDLQGPEIAALLQLHLDAMQEHSPPESVFALDLEGLRVPQITFWSAWDGAALAGCAALRDLGGGVGEVKSMRTAPAHLRKGVASTLLAHLIAVARTRAYVRLNLETGSGQPFAAAQALYARFGFEPCGPFGDYSDEIFSRYFTLVL